MELMRPHTTPARELSGKFCARGKFRVLCVRIVFLRREVFRVSGIYALALGGHERALRPFSLISRNALPGE